MAEILALRANPADHFGYLLGDMTRTGLQKIIIQVFSGTTKYGPSNKLEME